MGASDLPFFKKAEEYTRMISHRRYAIDQAALLLARQRNLTFEQAFRFVNHVISKEGPFPLKDPIVRFMELLPCGNHVESAITFSEYINRTIKNREYLAPSGTTYKNVRDEESLQAIRLKRGVKERKMYKNLMFKAESENDLLGRARYHNLQNSKKTANNGNSGTYNSDGNPLINPPAHTTLTSTCRMTSGLGNANNEMLISGNRHYFNHKVVIHHIGAIMHSAPLEDIEAVVEKYKLHYPTHDEVMSVIIRCTQLYFFYNKNVDKVTRIVAKMTPVERAAFCYIGDMYTLRRFNPEFTKNFLMELTEKVHEEVNEPVKVIKSHYDTVRILSTTLCQEEMEGKGDRFHEVSAHNVGIIAGTCNHIKHVIDKYEDLIRSFYATNVLPIGVAYFPSSIRRVTPISDTDSTMFTVQEWLQWNSGNYKLAGDNLRIWYGMTFMASTTIVNLLAQMSKNIGIEDSNLFEIAMKSEFLFRQIIPMNVGKHYGATAFIQEGVVLKKTRLERKGVALNSAAMPEVIRNQITEILLSVDKDMVEKGTISIYKYLSWAVRIEKEIERSMLAAEPTFFKTEKIKVPGSYTKDEDESPYKHHTFWNDTFGVKYGYMPEPPYGVKKVPVKLTRKEFANWAASIEDKELREAFQRAILKYGINKLSLIRIPSKILMENGMLSELKSIINIRGVTMDIMKPIYMLLEALGVYAMGEKRVNQLLSETYREYAVNLPPLRLAA